MPKECLPVLQHCNADCSKKITPRVTGCAKRSHCYNKTINTFSTSYKANRKS